MEARAGDEVEASAPSFEAVYRAHFRFVWRVARSLGVPVERAEDAVQEVFVIVHRLLPGHDGGSVRAWLYEITRRVAHDFRRTLRRKSLGEPLSEEVPARDSADPARAAAATEELRIVEAILAELDEDKRTVFVLADIEQMTAAEISDVVGIPLNTVYSRLRAARQQFHAAAATALGSRERPRTEGLRAARRRAQALAGARRGGPRARGGARARRTSSGGGGGHAPPASPRPFVTRLGIVKLGISRPSRSAAPRRSSCGAAANRRPWHLRPPSSRARRLRRSRGLLSLRWTAGANPSPRHRARPHRQSSPPRESPQRARVAGRERSAEAGRVLAVRASRQGRPGRRPHDRRVGGRRRHPPRGGDYAARSGGAPRRRRAARPRGPRRAPAAICGGRARRGAPRRPRSRPLPRGQDRRRARRPRRAPPCRAAVAAARASARLVRGPMRTTNRLLTESRAAGHEGR